MLPAERRAQIIQSLTADEQRQLVFLWRFWARESQLPPHGEEWRTWMVQAGRGFGKTRVGAEWVRSIAERTAKPVRIALVAPTAADARDTMVEGESGLLAISPPWFRPTYEPSKRRVTWPNGTRATLFSADEPERLRGPQHHFAWCDEVGSWFYPEAWDQLQFGLRLGDRPRAVVTTTPRPTQLIRRILSAHDTVITRGSTFDNAANLAPSFVSEIRKIYEGTRLGRQELYAELLDDTPGALWQLSQLDTIRVSYVPPLRRIVVAIDPSVTASEDSDECGIIVAGIDDDGLGYVLEDLSGVMSPQAWATRAVNAYHRWRADRVVAETNNGGDLVESTIRTVDRSVSYRGVRAARAKRARAEPVAALYEQGRIRHRAEGLPKRGHDATVSALEEQMTTWDASASDRSPDRVDALVWALTDLMLTPQGRRTVVRDYTEQDYE